MKTPRQCLRTQEVGLAAFRRIRDQIRERVEEFFAKT
jgi:hypothetical protein